MIDEIINYCLNQKQLAINQPNVEMKAACVNKTLQINDNFTVTLLSVVIPICLVIMYYVAYFLRGTWHVLSISLHILYKCELFKQEESKELGPTKDNRNLSLKDD